MLYRCAVLDDTYILYSLMFFIAFSRKFFPNENPPGALHTAMFLPTLEAQAANDQLKKWAKAAKNYFILGTYAQTEMGHGL